MVAKIALLISILVQGLIHGPTAPSPIAPSPLEQQMYNAVNAERSEEGLAPLVIDDRLVILARERSEDMVARNYFAHTTPEGKMIFNYLDERNIYSPYAGENLGRTNGEDAVALIMADFMNSEPHRKNVLGAHYTLIGIGEVATADGMHYFSLVFVGEL